MTHRFVSAIAGMIYSRKTDHHPYFLAFNQSHNINRVKGQHYINSSPLSAEFMRQRTGSTLVQVMVCCLFGAKPLPEPVLAYCQLDY